MRVRHARTPSSRGAPRRLQAGSAGSALLHGLLLAALLFRQAGDQKEEQPAAPSFAVEFTDADIPAPGQAAAPSQPQVRLGGEDLPPAPPPEDRPVESVPVPPPLHRYGTALHPRASGNPFAHVVPFDLSPRARSFASNLNGRGLDLSAGPVVRNGRLTEAVAHTIGSNGLGDWMERLREFVEDHKYYPHEAVENGEQGSAVLRVTVLRDGTVKNIQLVSSSGSHLLDAAWMSVFRDNKLPAFNDDIRQDQITLPVELDYSLIYQH